MSLRSEIQIWTLNEITEWTLLFERTHSADISETKKGKQHSRLNTTQTIQVFLWLLLQLVGILILNSSKFFGICNFFMFCPNMKKILGFQVITFVGSFHFKGHFLVPLLTFAIFKSSNESCLTVLSRGDVYYVVQDAPSNVRNHMNYMKACIEKYFPVALFIMQHTKWF